SARIDRPGGRHATTPASSYSQGWDREAFISGFNRFPSAGGMRMRVSKNRVGLAIVTICMVATASLTYAQATSTFNGRVLGQGDAVLPGVTVTATNTATGVARTAVTNAEGQYFMPGLEPGTYEVKTELAGFAPSARDNVRLAINATLTIDFKLALAGVNETLTVTGEAPLIEATQSKVANTIQTTELQNLPMITRTISGMLELLPGA